jgi:hypothetical protein
MVWVHNAATIIYGFAYFSMSEAQKLFGATPKEKAPSGVGLCLAGNLINSNKTLPPKIRVIEYKIVMKLK